MFQISEGSSDEYQKLTILKQSASGTLKPCLSMSIVSANQTCTLLFPNAHSTVDIAEFGKYEKVFANHIGWKVSILINYLFILLRSITYVGVNKMRLSINGQNRKRDFLHRFLSNEKWENNQHAWFFFEYCFKSIQFHTILLRMIHLGIKISL